MKQIKESLHFLGRNDLLLFLCIFTLALFFRLFRLEENFYFSGEVGHNLLAIKNAFESKQIPLIGPPTSHPWLYFGPLYYWIYGPVLVLSKFNPISHAYFGNFIALLSLLVHYVVIRKLTNARVALLSSFIISFSPLYLEFAHFSRFFTAVGLLIYPLVYLLHVLNNSNKKLLFWIFFVFGCMFSFHYSPLMLIPLLAVVFYVKRINFTLRDVGISFVGFIIPLIPFLIYDSTHGLQMTRNIILWIPYRVAGFLGLYPKNTVSSAVLQENATSFSSFFIKSFLPGNSTFLGVLLIIITVAYILFMTYRVIRQRRNYSVEMLLVVWFLAGYVAIFIHGSPPSHYFVPLLPLPIIFFSLLLDRVWNRRRGWIIVIFILILLFSVTVRYYSQSGWFHDKVLKSDVPYKDQVQIAKSIVGDAKGQKFTLMRKGTNDQFEENYAQNYMYLLWLYGNEPMHQAALRYTIVEYKKPVLERNDTIVKNIGNVFIVKRYIR